MDEEEVTGEPWDDDTEEVDAPALPDTREDFEARLTAEREKAASEARAQAEAEFNKRRSDLDRSKNELLSNLRELGLDRTEGGKIGVTDPAKAMALLVGAQPAKAEATDEPLGNPWDEGYTEKLAAKIARDFEAKLEANNKQWEQKVQSLTGMTLQTQQPAVEQAVAKTFERIGLAGMQDEPEFKQFMAEALNQPGYDPMALANPQYMSQLAATAVPLLPDEVIDRVKARVEKRRSEEAALESRQSARREYTQMQSSNGTRMTSERGGRPSSAELDLAGQLLEAAYTDDSGAIVHSGYSKDDRDLNLAIAHGKELQLLEKRKKAGARR